MRKFLKTLSFVMSAAVSLAAVPMISADNTDVSAEFDADYCMNPCNYAWCKQYNKTYRKPPEKMYRNSPKSVQDLARKCTSKPIMI